MKTVAATIVAPLAGLLVAFGPATGNREPWFATAHGPATAGPTLVSRGISTAALSEVVRQYCQGCHNERSLKGNLSLVGYNVDAAYEKLEASEKMIRKLRADMMPPPGARRPGGDTLVALVETLEKVIDNASRPNPGTRTFQRMNRPEYERAVRDLLGLEVNAGDYLPLDTKSANFDNIADAQALSPTLLEAYLNAAAAISRMAVGDRNAPLTATTYRSSPFVSQHPWNHVEGAPYGTRGGIVAVHGFPADAEYVIRVNVGGGVGTQLEDVDISINGERVALLHYERGVGRNLASADAPAGADYLLTDPIFVRAGQHRISAAFVRRTEGPYEDLIKPHDWSKASNGTASAGTTEPPHLLEVTVTGPKNATGVSVTPSRRLVFSCHPSAVSAQRACAERIINRLGARAYRRPLTARDREGLMGFYKAASATGGFEEGVRAALQAMLASPHFVFRIESAPLNVAPGHDYRISDYDLASRLSFFLWGSLPDTELLTLAHQRKLGDEKVLRQQVRRMLADPRAEALASRFAAQWLRLQDLEKVRPDAFWFPDFDEQLAESMRRETQRFFYDIVQRNGSVLDLFTADYTYVNERLARHYGIPNITGTHLQRVQYLDDTRRGLLGHGSVLVQTSLANRTSPVLRGKWVMEVLIGMPPPPPPPGVPDLEETQESKDGKLLTTRERMEIHRSNATCRACHQYMDPIGLALDNFDVTGRWRFRENGMPLDTRGEMYDGTAVTSPADLTRALVKRPIPLVRSFTENLMAYALGRRIEDYDQPTVRALTRGAEQDGYRISSLILGVVSSHAFRSKRADGVADSPEARPR
jgi:hypothetical protein